LNPNCDNPAGLRRRAMRMLVGCTALWALSFPAMKALALTQQGLLPQPGSWFFTSLSVTYRFGAAGAVLLLLGFRQLRTLHRLEVEQGMVLALFGGLGILFQMDGLAYTSASTSAFLTQGYCIFIPVWLALVQRQWPSRKTFLCIALVVAGVAVLAGINVHSFSLGRGEIETLLASLLFTGQILGVNHPRYAANRPLCFSTVMLLGTALVGAPFACATAPEASAWLRAYGSPAACGLLGIIIAFCTLAAFIVMNVWQRRVTATEAGLIYCAEPVFASLLALFLPGIFSAWAGIHYPNETLTAQLLVGGGLITSANVLLQTPWLEGKQTGAADDAA
jgi:drug/metabolite transporter (DMT)-like permease